MDSKISNGTKSLRILVLVLETKLVDPIIESEFLEVYCVWVMIVLIVFVSVMVFKETLTTV